MKCALLGAWSWWTAIAQVLAGNNHEAWLRSIKESDVKNIMQYRENKEYLPWAELKEWVFCSLNLEEVVNNAEIIVLSLPSHALRSGLDQLKKYYNNQTIVLATKWWRSNHFLPLSTLVEEFLWEDIPLVVLSWASHAEEVVRWVPTGVVLASKDLQQAEKIKTLLQNDWFRCVISEDIVWVQLSWWLKNVLALACWLSDGLWFGVNTKALIITEGIKEIKCIGEQLWIELKSIFSYAGIGDIYVTCSSTLSRNWKAGNALAQGYTKQEIISWKVTNMVCEGLYIIDIFEEYIKTKQMNLPLIETLIGIINGNKDTRKEFENFIKNI